ncbi:MAG: hypothetical protein ABI082_11320 [Dokdonella sp.]
MILSALFLLWRKSGSVWLIVAIAAELFGITFLGILKIAPSVAQSIPIFFPMWTLSALAMAIALFAYAIEITQRPGP